MKIFGARSLTAVLSRVATFSFYFSTVSVVIILLFLIIGPLVKPDFIEFIFSKASIYWFGNGMLLTHPGGKEFADILFTSLLFCAPVSFVQIAALYYLKGLFADFRRDVVFSEKQAIRLKRIGVLGIAAGFLYALPDGITASTLVDLIHIDGVTITKHPFIVNINVISIIDGIFFIISSYVITRGVRLNGAEEIER